MKCDKNCKHILHLVMLALIVVIIAPEFGCFKCKDYKYKKD